MATEKEGHQMFVFQTLKRRESISNEQLVFRNKVELGQDNISAIFRKENTQNKVFSDEEKASRMELQYCIGEIDFLATGKKQGKFLKVPCAIHPGVIFDLMSNKWNLPAPNLVVSFVGEEEHFQVKPWLRDKLRKGLVKAAQSTGAWIFTSGLHVGITKHIGQAVQDHMLTSSSSTVKVVAIGITSLEKIQHRDLLENVKNDILINNKTDNNVQGHLYSLDNHHSHFILVEESEPDGTTKLQLALEKYISEQHTSYGGTGSIEIPVLCLLVNGRPHILERIFKGLKNSIPCLILAGSGGIADILAALMSEPHLIVPQVVEKQLKQKFPTEHFTWNDIVHWTEMIQSIITQEQLLTIHDFEQEGSEELDTVILKALVKACKSHSQEAQEYLDELKLAVAWNRVDIAKSEIFNGDVEWTSCDLEEVLMDALVNDKPEFVKLFIDNGANIYDFLTYGRLQSLYCNISPKSLLYMLLLKKHEENRLTLAGMSGQHHKEVVDVCPLFTLHEVSRVLKDFLHDACKGFYHDQKPGGKKKVDKTNARKFPTIFDMHQKSGNPWRDLFLWAVLQNRHEMAHLFWAMGPEGVAAALAACQIVREMSHLETEAEVVRRMKEAKYEQLAVELFSECYHDSEERAFALLVRKNRYWSKTTCLHLATKADAKSFFAHDGVQAFLTNIWWGDMSTSTPILNLICGFGCPFLIYTNLISFSEESVSEEDSESFKDLDRLDTERTLLSYTKTEADARLEAEPASGNIAYATFMFTRWKKFWTAPVTVFMGNVVMYFAFLFLFAYVLLVDFKPPPKGPSIEENILYFWVFTLVLEEIRQSFFTDEDMNLIKKFKLYVEDNWNKCDMLAISLFIIGITCRMFKSTFHDGRTVLAIDFMVFTLRLIHIFAIHKQLGPKIIIVERMMKDVFFFLFFLSVWLIAYGVATQALLHPNDSRAEWIFRRVLYRPYLQIFGQIPLDKIDLSRMDFENCTLGQQRNQTASDFSCPSAYANWVVIILLVIFLLVTNVLLMNLLIAMFSYTFQVVQGNADIFWKFQRYNLIVEYHGRPAFAPPFIIIDHVKLFLRWALKKTEHKKEHLERDIPEELDQKLITWEMLQKENYLANLETKKKESNEEKLKKMSDKVDSLLKNFSGLKEQEKQLKSLESQISYCTIMLSSMADTLVKNSLFFSGPTSNNTCTDQMVVPENEDGVDTCQFDDVICIDN
ncbi:PREDICTED: transient receptor potential cation channel subfamily M member 5 isoform X1 [Thamnophis sirtalis]|uniref:Transient receptor potential cation channel subfamily M member 5 isoform X1 n=1 Tax=Thamnophis sirtalis TaxID=35019 RepID=A0A6I9XDA0_9SAUR|nr:PREDICTED: transient receptor potential cation channel subfamily M member 5 isoform X1 [Thamnophis sirtalis]